jgi:hypothetical protein
MVAAELATLKHGTNQRTGKFAAPTQAEAADLLNVSERTVRTARELVDSETAEPELIEAVDRGERAGCRRTLQPEAAPRAAGGQATWSTVKNRPLRGGKFRRCFEQRLNQAQ